MFLAGCRREKMEAPFAISPPRARTVLSGPLQFVRKSEDWCRRGVGRFRHGNGSPYAKLKRKGPEFKDFGTNNVSYGNYVIEA
jgi:hypothetical protein